MMLHDEVLKVIAGNFREVTDKYDAVTLGTGTGSIFAPEALPIF